MKHQYESEILFHLMERDGFNIPSSVPPYESEIKAYLINQVKLAYPKLTDYEAEWLLYNYTKHLPADFPISSATNVTEATFENVVPFAYQSAILKGDTIVSHYSSDIIELTANGSWIENPVSLTQITLPVKPSTDYLFVVEIIENSLIGNETVNNSLRFGETESTGKFPTVFKSIIAVPLHQIGMYRFILTTKADISNIDLFDRNQLSKHCTGGKIKFRYVVIEYQQRMENLDIPYFEGMQSVKMPVLTTTGKNLFDGELEIGGLSNVNGLPVDNQPDRCRTINYIKVNSSTDYVISLSHSGIVGIREFDEDYKLVSWSSLPKENTFTTTNKTKYLKFIIVNKNVDNLVQLEEGTTATPYEPYKTNILTVNEDVTLRGIGVVQDTLDCLTGELTQRIGELVLDGNENWTKNATKELTQVFELKTSNYRDNTSQINSLGLPNGTNGKDIEAIILGSSGSLYLAILKTKASTVEELKTYLSSNHITVQCQLKQESVKTVELKTVNESGESIHFMPLEGTMHVQSSGEIIQPTFDMSVPVEATTQNLASFIDLEMEE